MATSPFGSQQRKMAIKLSVVVPCYNEEKRFLSGFNHYYAYLAKQHYSWELIFINDGSGDKTFQQMQKNASHDKRIRIVSYNQNHGKGYAIARGIKKANGRYILFSDLDHSVPIKTIEGFFEYFKNGYLVVIGSRRVPGAKILVRQHPLREWFGRGFTFLVKVLIYWGIKDATCGFKAFENSASRKLFSKIRVYDWAFDAEILFLCKKYGFKLAQAPVAWSDVKGTKVALKRDIIRSFVGLFKIRLNDLRGKYSE